MRATQYILKFIIILVIISSSFGAYVVPAKSASSLQLDIISSTETETILELTINNFTSETFIEEGKTFQSIYIDQTVQSSNIGEPQVPVYSTMIGVVNPDDLSIEVMEEQSVSYQGYTLPNITNIEVTGDNLLEQNASVKVVKDTEQFSNKISMFLPERKVEISQSGYLRDQGFAQITFYPIQYCSGKQELVFTKHIIVRVTSNIHETNPLDNNKEVLPEFESILKNTLVNYADLVRPIASKIDLPSPKNLTQSINPSIITPTLKITTDQEGLYQLTYEEMINAGFDPTTIDSSTYQLTNQGIEIAIQVQDGGNGYIDIPGDRILFYGTAINDVYTNKNVFWLTYSEVNGKRMTEQDGTPGSGSQPKEFQNLLHAEQDTYYWQTMPNGEGQDHWFWGGRLSPNTEGLPSTRTFTVTLDNISDTDGLIAKISINLKGGTDDVYWSMDHHTRVYINDQSVNDWYWGGFENFYAEQEISQSAYLVEGVNTVKIECLDVPDVSVDQIFVNWFEITYWDTYRAENDQLYFRAPTDDSYKFHLTGFTDPQIDVFNITDPANIINFTNIDILPEADTYSVEFQDDAPSSDRYLAISNSQLLTPSPIELDSPSSWKTPDHGADYILITYDGFYDQVQPLADFRTSQGLRAEVVKVQDIYDEFNYGIFNPQAIRDFFTYAYEYWQAPAPLYVLLVGDAYQDYKDNLHTGSINYVPTQIVETVALGQTPSDNWFVQIVGNDILPDMFIGRLSAQTTGQVNSIVQKIIQYEQDEDPSSWSTQAVFVADDDQSSFETDSDAFAKLLPSGYAIQKIYVDDYPPGDPTEDILNAVDSGTMMMNYLGHGGVDQWGIWDDGQNILDNSSVGLMNNSDKHVFITMESCLNGLFTGKQSTYSLAETLQRHSNGGAIAVWAPSGLSYSNGHKFMITELYKAFFPWGIYGLGQATTLAKWKVYDQGSVWSDLVNTYILFGDPATRLGAAPMNHLFIPAVNRAP